MFSNINDHELVKMPGMESFPAILSLQNASDKIFCNTGIYTSILLVPNSQQNLLSSFQIKFQTPNLNALFLNPYFIEVCIPSWKWNCIMQLELVPDFMQSDKG